MSAPLRPGDAVRIVRWHCSAARERFEPRISVIEELVTLEPGYRLSCGACGLMFPLTACFLQVVLHCGRYPRGWVKRLPPLTPTERKAEESEYVLDGYLPLYGERLQTCRNAEIEIAELARHGVKL